MNQQYQAQALEFETARKEWDEREKEMKQKYLNETLTLKSHFEVIMLISSFVSFDLMIS